MFFRFCKVIISQEDKGIKMNKSRKMVHVVVAMLLAANIYALTGCGKTENASPHTDNETPIETSEIQLEDTEVQTAVEVIQTQEMIAETGSIMRAYSDKEKERMNELQESYQKEAVKPEHLIQEVDSAEKVTEGVLCYITSTGEYYLPDRELTDEELLEIIDCNFRIAIGTNDWSQEKIDEVNQKERAMLEEKVQAAGGLSEKQAIEIAQKAMEADLGDRGKKLKLIIDETYGWSSDLCVADWSEIKEEDRGEIAYCIGFNNAENVMDWKELINYVCVVNAVDGSILEAYEIQGFDSTVYYEH